MEATKEEKLNVDVEGAQERLDDVDVLASKESIGLEVP